MTTNWGFYEMGADAHTQPTPKQRQCRLVDNTSELKNTTHWMLTMWVANTLLGEGYG